MAGSRAEHLARRTASAATGPPAGRPRGGATLERRVDPEPRVEHPEDDDDGHAEDDLSEEEASWRNIITRPENRFTHDLCNQNCIGKKLNSSEKK